MLLALIIYTPYILKIVFLLYTFLYEHDRYLVSSVIHLGS
jgi:hypothetical protein